jgi:pimeloyl-ACP methyl ester carboxylesterase
LVPALGPDVMIDAQNPIHLPEERSDQRSGHFPFYEEPEAFVKVVEEFLAQ